MNQKQLAYIYSFVFIFALIITYFAVTVRADSTSYNVNNALIPGLQTENLKQLYSSKCSTSKTSTLRYKDNYFISNRNGTLLGVQVPGDITYLEIGYADNIGNCSSISLTNPKSLYKQSLQASGDINTIEINTFIEIPLLKYPFIYFEGSQDSAFSLNYLIDSPE